MHESAERMIVLIHHPVPIQANGPRLVVFEGKLAKGPGLAALSRAPYVAGLKFGNSRMPRSYSAKPSEYRLLCFHYCQYALPDVNTIHLKGDIVFGFCLLILMNVQVECGSAFEEKIARIRSMRTQRDYNRREVVMLRYHKSTGPGNHQI